MKFGSKVWLIRGSYFIPPGTPGYRRIVRGTLIGARKNHVRVRLDQDDPSATIGYCLRKGDIGWWGKSAVSPRES